MRSVISQQAEAHLLLYRLAQDPESIDVDAVQVDTQSAAETLQTLQSQIEDVILPNTLSTLEPPQAYLS